MTTVKPGQLEQPDFSEQTIDSADQGQMPAMFSVSGTELMTTRRLVRRALLAAAVSTATMVPTNDSGAFGVESSKTGSGIQQVQYQSGQASPPPSGTVSQELNRMFQESGQPMPSMQPQDLPNAQGQQSGMVRQKLQPGQTQQGQNGEMVQQKSQPAKKNFLQKFMGKISGKDKQQTEAAVVPPVPPGYREPMPAPPAADNSPLQTAQKQNGRPGTPATGQRRAPNGTALPVKGGLAGAQSRPRPGDRVGDQTRRASEPSQPGPGVPAGRGVARSSSDQLAAQSVSNGATPGTAQTPKYTQPGTAPAFMPAQPTTRPAVSAVAKPIVSAPPVKRSEPKTAPPVDDGFVDPFTDSEVADAAGDALDLDSLDLDAIAEKLPDGNAVARSTPEPEQATATPVIASSPAATGTSADTIGTDEQPGEPPESNPFTGVTLNESGEALFGEDSASTADGAPSTQVLNPAEAAPAAATTAVADGEFGGSAHPVEEFASNLPAIALPPVEEGAAQPFEIDANEAALNTSDLDSEESVETAVAATLEQTPTTSDNAAPQSSSGSAGPQPADGSGSEASPLQNVNAEKLQQAAEQDLRLRQQRLILSRSGQTGFKGFCPVALRDRRELVEASPEFTATFGLQTYTFATFAAKSAFEAEPSRYAPAAGGSDVVLLVNSGEEQAGLLDYALWHRDRLYLFRSRESMGQFAQDPQRFASQY